MSKRVPQKNQKVNKHMSDPRDRCQTPMYALDPILPLIPPGSVIWEPAQGEGQLVTRLRLEGLEVIGTDLLQGVDYFRWEPEAWDIQITNTPFGPKYAWLARALRLGRPFALLMPTNSQYTKNWLEACQGREAEIACLTILPRINFKMPNLGYSGGGAQMSTSWFCWGLGAETGTISLPPRPDLEFAPITYGAGIQVYQPGLWGG